MSTARQEDEDRRVQQRRSNVDRRQGERRSVARPTADRRELVVTDRRSGTDRRAYSPA